MPAKQKNVAEIPFRRKSILVVDDHSVFRAGLISILKDQADLEVGGEAIDYASGLAAVRAKPFDLVIVDIGLGETADGLELIKSIKAEQPDLHILIVSSGMNRFMRTLPSRRRRRVPDEARNDRSAGASTAACFLGRNLSQLSDAAAGPGQLRPRLFGTGTAVDLLSDRELEILHLVGHGIDVRKIAADLNLSPKTVQTYRDRIRQKLAFANARELARFAHEWVGTEEN